MKKNEQPDEKEPIMDTGCLAYLIIIVFLIYYSFFPTYEASLLNSASEELDSIQFWIGLIGTVFLTYIASMILVVALNYLRVKLRTGFLLLLVLNAVCWFTLPDLVIDNIGEFLASLLD